MDDRFRPEKPDFNKIKNPVPPNISRSNLGDFSENIDSVQKNNFTASGISGTPKPKKFEVHLPEEADLIPDVVPAAKSESSPVLKDVTGQSYLNSIQNKPSASSAGRAVPRVNQTKNSVEASKPPVRRTAVQNTAATSRKTASSSVKSQAKTRHKTSGSSRNTKKRAKQRYNFINSVLVTCVCVIFISILTVTASTVAMTTINDILVIDRDSADGYVSVYIPAEVTEYEGVFEILKDTGLIRQPIITNLFCKFRNYNEVDVKREDGTIETVRIKYEPGTYFFDADMGVESMLEEMMVSSSKAKDTVRLTFPEGWTVAQIFEKIEKYGVCEAEKLYANLEIVANQYDILKNITAPTGRYLKAEGYLFPDTYDFFIGENASSVIKKLINNFEVKWKEEYNARLKALNITFDQAIIIASVIQREAKDTTQMDVISSVIHNRLQNSATYPSIDMNSTKDYVLSLKEYNLFSDFYYNLYLNAYNTYSNPGLPPGPICNPGAAAIRAALYPEETEYCFFCHNDSGEIFLAKTASEHQANTEKVLYGTIGD